MLHTKYRIVLLATVGLITLPYRASAQAWLPPAGSAIFIITYQRTSARGELNRFGDLHSTDGVTRAQAFTPEIEWGVTDRIAVNATLPLIAARYVGPGPHEVDHRGEPTTIDDGRYHGGTQDFRFGVRYALKTGPFAVAPFTELVVPSREYDYQGHSAIGDGLWLFRVGANIGGFLDRLAPGLYAHTQLSYTVAERLVGIRTNRSRLESEVGYFLTPRLSVRFMETLVITHDGLKFPEARHEIREFFLNHDPLQRRNFLTLGGGASFALSESVGMFAAATAMVWGQTVHPVRGISMGLTYSLRTGSTRAMPDRSSRPALASRVSSSLGRSDIAP